jgi:hypothetical protein
LSSLLFKNQWVDRTCLINTHKPKVKATPSPTYAYSRITSRQVLHLARFPETSRSLQHPPTGASKGRQYALAVDLRGTLPKGFLGFLWLETKTEKEFPASFRRTT